MSLSKRASLMGASALLSFGVIAGLSALPASAQAQATATSAASPKYCNHDACAQVVSNVHGKLSIRVWAHNKLFFGHFELKTPAHTIRNAPPGHDMVWNAGGRGYTYKNVEYLAGKYHAIAWQSNGNGGYNNIGEVTFPG